MKILVAEDDSDVLETMVGELGKAGFDLQSRLPEDIISDSWNGLAQIISPAGEVHITGSANVLADAVKEHGYDLIFLDALLLNDASTFDVGTELLCRETPPKVIAVSNGLNAQMHVLSSRLGEAKFKNLRERGILSAHFKNGFSWSNIVMEVLGIEPPRPQKKSKRLDKPTGPSGVGSA